jgi:hypothetical protein
MIGANEARNNCGRTHAASNKQQQGGSRSLKSLTAVRVRELEAFY